MRRCFRFVILGFLLLITFTPTVADALPYNTVVYGPLTSTTDGVQTVEVGVVAFGKYDAAMVALGYDGAFINGLSDDDRAKLSNQETGGEFWSFAQKFTLAPNDDLMSLNGITWKSLNALYGYGNVRRGVYTQGEASNAKRDMLKILSDGGLGGGGSQPTDGYYTFKSNIYFYGERYSSSNYYLNDSSGVKYTNLYKYTGLDNSTYKLLPETVTLRIPEQVLSTLNDKFPYESNTWYVYMQIYNGKIDLNVVAGNVINPDVKTQSLSDEGKPTIVNEYISKLNYTYESIYVSHLSFSSDYTYDNGVITYTGTSGLSASIWPNGNSFWSPFLGTFYLKKADVIPSVPPSNWPSEPETPAPSPTAPEVPEPSEPDLPSQPVMPTAPSLPDFPSNVITAGTTYETFDIQAILDAMDEHCQHLQSAVYQGFSDYFDTF